MIVKLSIFNIKELFKKLIYSQNSVQKLALSCAIGIYIAFCPFIGFHNIMIFAFSWLFRLNFLATFTAAHINNPITTIPILAVTYFFSKWLLHDIMRVSFAMANPGWLNFITKNLSYYLPMPKFCFWTFFWGSNFLAIVLALISYPISLLIFKKLTQSAKA